MSARLLHHLLWESAQRTPEAEAVVHLDDVLKYGELDEQSSRLANGLMELGVAPGDHVALYLRKSASAVVAIYAILQTGASYVPIEFSNPASRLQDILTQCYAECIITDAKGLGKLSEAEIQATKLRAAVVVDEAPRTLTGPLTVLPLADVLATAPGLHRLSNQTERDLAYVLFTSGSTGIPKGVMHSHRSAMAFVRWSSITFAVAPNDRLSNHAPFNFDLAIFDIFASAAAGAAVCLVPDGSASFPFYLGDFIESQRISIWYSVPSVLTRLAKDGGLIGRDLERLRLVLFAGEVFPIKDLRALMTMVPKARYFNLYGPTETNVCTFHEVSATPALNDPPVPIGRACANTEALALTEGGARIVARGEPGILYVRGPGVMTGYLGRPRDTDAVFVESPLEAGGDRFYCTGDWVTTDDDAEFRFLGRRDHLVKIGGYRVELGEVEAAIHTHRDIVDAVAIAVPDELLGMRLVAVVVTREGSLNERLLRRHCALRLPSYMIPSKILLRSELPRTSNDKVNREQLRIDAIRELR